MTQEINWCIVYVILFPQIIWEKKHVKANQFNLPQAKAYL